MKQDARTRLVVLAIHALVFAALLAWSWRKWPDPLVDFGRELYLPWQINQGRVLYRDLASLFGPLSPYVNALWFWLFGTSLLTLALCNVAIFAATVAGIHRLVRVATDRVTAGAASLSTVLLFGFSQYDAVGNYNFVTPYSHEATHGVALSVAALVSLHHALTTRSRRSWVVAGACFGLTLLTKPEVAIAAAAAVAAGWAAAYAVGNGERRALVARGALFVAAAITPSLLFFLYFSTQMAPQAALGAIAGAWTPLFGTGIAGNQFYRHVMGLDAPARNAALMLLAFVGFLAFVAAAIAVSWNSAAKGAMRRLLRLGLLVLVFAALTPGEFPRALPLITFTTFVAAVWLMARARNDRVRATRLIPLVLWSAFALVLLAKLGLYARVYHYGFYLALPATVTAIVLATWLLPHALATWKGEADARTFRRLALFALAGLVAPYFGLAHAWYRSKTLSIGSGSDRFYASTLTGQGPLVRDALEELQRIARPGATLAVMPEGVMLNYLLRLDSPLRVINLTPPALMVYGEDEVLRSLQAKPPDLVLLVARSMREYGYPAFGSDPRYGLSVLTWVHEHYDTVPVKPGASLFQRRAR